MEAMAYRSGAASRCSVSRAPAARGGAGFTLVELLVVVGIIAILATLLVPSLAQTKHLGRRAQCLSNLRNIGVAACGYAVDNRLHIPRGNQAIWFHVLLPYLEAEFAADDYRAVPIYRCPSFPNPQQTVCYVDSSWSFDGRDDMVGWEILEPTPIARFSNPGGTIYLADNEDGYWRPIIKDRFSRELDRLDVWHPTHLPTSDAKDITYGRRVARERHFEGCNCMYVDGSAAWIRAKEMTVDMWRDRWY